MATATINENLQEKEEQKETSKPSENSSPPSPRKDVIQMQTNEASKFNKFLLIPLIFLMLIFAGLAGYFLLIKKTDFVAPFETYSDQIKETISSTMGDTYENPLNGAIFPAGESAEFKDKKPVAVMVNNYVVARPSAGLSYADVIYEAVAEGGITRLMPIFHSQEPERVSSIRSARYYFVELAAGYKAHYIHWGAAHVPPCQKEPISSPNYCPPVGGKVETKPDVDAYARIAHLGVANLDGGNYSCDADTCAFGRDPNKLGKVPLEHTAFIRFPLIFEKAREIRPENSWHQYIPIVEWKFKDDAEMVDRGDIGATVPITYNYWDTMPGFNVKWVYDKDANEYIRYQGDVKQTDAINGKELRAKTVVIRFTEQEPVGDKKNHLYHKLVGTGDALIFEDGNVIKGMWSRSTHEDRDVYKDLQGNQIEFVRGQIWIQLLPIDNQVSYSAPTT